MATGAGKTFTACTLSYRLLAHAGFKRILFLADRANLVRQTRDEYLAALSACGPASAVSRTARPRRLIAI